MNESRLAPITYNYSYRTTFPSLTGKGVSKLIYRSKDMIEPLHEGWMEGGGERGGREGGEGGGGGEGEEEGSREEMSREEMSREGGRREGE